MGVFYKLKNKTFELIKIYYIKLCTLVKPTLLCIPLHICTSPQSLVSIGHCIVILEGVMDSLAEVTKFYI